MCKLLKKIDLFGQFITLRYDKKIKHPTMLGGSCSLLIILLAFGYFIMCLYFMFTFQKIYPSSSISNIYDENMVNTYKDMGLDYVFSFKFNDGNSISYDDLRTYIRIYVQQNGNEEYDLVECKKENLLINRQNPSSQQQVFNTIQSKGQLNLCVDPNHYKKIAIRGMDSYFSFKVEKCKISPRSRIGCKPPDLLEEFLKNIYLYSYNFEIKKDLRSRDIKNLISTKEINKYNGSQYGIQQSIEFKQELDLNTYDIQDSFIYIKNATTEQGQYFTVQKPQVISVKPDENQLLQINVFYSGQQNNYLRTCYNLQNALNDTFSVVGSVLAFLSFALFELQQILFGFKIIQKTFYKKDGKGKERERQRLSCINKIFLMKHSILSKIIPWYNKCCFSFFKLNKEDQNLLYFYKTAKNKYDQFIDLGNIIKDIQDMKKMIYKISADQNVQIGIQNFKSNDDWDTIDILKSADEMKKALEQIDKENFREQDKKKAKQNQVNTSNNNYVYNDNSQNRNNQAINYYPGEGINFSQISMSNQLSSNQKGNGISVDSD